MIRLKDILKETQELQQLPTELKRHFLEIISTYGAHRESMSRKSDIRQVAETLGGIADAAQEYTLREGGDWFDRVTIKRNMNELKKLQKSFEKEAIEAKAQEQRLEALYEDMGNVLGRYFEIADVSEDVMKQRLGLNEVSIDIKVGDMVKVDNPHWEAALGKKGPFRRKVKMIDHDNAFFTDGSNSSLKYIKK